MLEQTQLIPREEFRNQQLVLRNNLDRNLEKTILRFELRDKIDDYKKLLAYKQMIQQKIKKLHLRGKQLETNAKNLSDNQKKQYPIFIVRPSFIAEKFITKEIKNIVIELGKKFNKLNDYNKLQLALYLNKHKTSNQMTKQFLKLMKQQLTIDNDVTRKINKQKLATLKKKLQVQALQTQNQNIIKQKQDLIESRKAQKQIYDNLKAQIQKLANQIGINASYLNKQKQQYLQDFNVAVCRQRIHSQFISQFKQNKLACILNQSFIDVQKQEQKGDKLKRFLRNKGIPQMFGKVTSYQPRVHRKSVSMSAPKIKGHHKRFTSKTDHTESTAHKTKHSFFF